MDGALGRRSLIAGVVGVAVAACGAKTSTPNLEPTPTEPTPAAIESPAPDTPTATASPVATGSPDLSSLYWYEVQNVIDVDQALSTRSLLFGALDGTFGGALPLGSIFESDRTGGAEPFAWTDPQADGVFNDQALVWGRDGQLGRIEAIDLGSGSLQTLVDANDVVHVATADAALSSVFYITADASTGEPSGLWLLKAGDPNGATRLPYEFGDAHVHTMRYALVANADGSLLAVQLEEGTVTVIDIAVGRSHEVMPGGQVIGFADDYLVSHGPLSRTGSRVVAFDPEGSGPRILAAGVTAAQTVRMGRDGLVAVETGSLAGFQIHAIDINADEASLVYSGQPLIDPELAPGDPKVIGYESPADTVLLASSFARLVGVLPPGREIPESAYPLLLNLRTGETIRTGPYDGG